MTLIIVSLTLMGLKMQDPGCFPFNENVKKIKKFGEFQEANGTTFSSLLPPAEKQTCSIHKLPNPNQKRT